MRPPIATFGATREAALQRLAEFVPLAGRYSRDRNKVLPGHPNVSRLSPAIRHGVVDPHECEVAALDRYAPSTVEKFVQELHWRRYWKAWLSLRPQVWADYRGSLDALRHDPGFEEQREHAERCEQGNSNVAIMNHFARELVETGYLHNHARMWFAAWWIHVDRLPWQLGADFFFRHLLDADPASNTLSWRWVAGLQTPGKTYLPRRSNIEKYVAPEILTENSRGLEFLENPRAHLPEPNARPDITQPDLKDDPVHTDAPLGIWIHEEDLQPEHGPLANLKPTTLITAGHRNDWKQRALPARRQAWLREALDDAADRASRHFQVPSVRNEAPTLGEALQDWARANRLRQVVALRPEVGPLADQLPAIRRLLAAAGASMRLVNRPEDLAVRPLATGGFFRFWKKIQSLSRKREKA